MYTAKYSSLHIQTQSRRLSPPKQFQQERDCNLLGQTKTGQRVTRDSRDRRILSRENGKTPSSFANHQSPINGWQTELPCFVINTFANLIFWKRLSIRHQLDMLKITEKQKNPPATHTRGVGADKLTQMGPHPAFVTSPPLPLTAWPQMDLSLTPYF